MIQKYLLSLSWREMRPKYSMKYPIEIEYRTRHLETYVVIDNDSD